jgi:hypothetical protein
MKDRCSGAQVRNGVSKKEWGDASIASNSVRIHWVASCDIFASLVSAKYTTEGATILKWYGWIVMPKSSSARQSSRG